jgi:hypothetical protein
VWLALWAQNRRRRRLRLAPSLLPAPVLRSEYPDKLAWDWNLANPYKWNVWQSLDGGVTYILSDGYWMYGDARQFAPDAPGELHFIVGVDASGNEITERSNAVRPDEALPPIDLLLDLFAYWKLDENEGNVRLDSSSSGYDLAEWDRFGDGGTIGQTSGHIADAALFNDGADVGLLHNSLSSWNNTGEFTIAGWFRYAANNYDSQFLVTVGNNLQIAVRPSEAAVNFMLITDGPDGYFRIQTADGSISEGPWIHFAAVKSGHRLTIYLNGIAAAPGSPLAGITPQNEPFPDLHVGCAPFGYPFNGAIDELGIWNRALYADEIATLYNNGDGLTYEQF